MQNWQLLVGRKPKLLIVDDQAINIRVLHELFRQECDLLMATDGEQAIALCRSELPDLVLLDIVMPNVDGHEVCRRLKADPLTQDIPIIFLTGQNSAPDEVRGFVLGAVDFISKPIHPIIVRARVKTHLALKLQSDMLRSFALLDGLTGIANRRKFDEDIEMHWRHCRREKRPLSLLLLDVDLFKLYNDRYGHLAGDECLRSLAQSLKLSINRPLDLLARYGGEEFVCILPNTDADGALDMAQNMLAKAHALRIEHLDSDVESIVTISVGAATLIPTDDHNHHDLIFAADKQLYTAKKAGRARVSSIELH